MLYDIGLVLAGLCAGAGLTVAYFWWDAIKELPESALGVTDDYALERETEAANAAYERGKADGFAIAVAEQKAKKRAAGLKAAQTRKLGDTIIGGEG